MGEKLANQDHEEVVREDGDWKHFLFDSENRTVLGRTATSWFHVTVFYAIYYSLIATLSYYCVMGYQHYMVVFPGKPGAHPTTSNRVSTPGVATFPGVDQIIIDANRVSGFGYIDKINDRIMKRWINFDEEANKAKLAALGDCSPICADEESDCANPPLRESYYSGNPCVFYQINKVMNWQPFSYQSLNDKHINPRVEKDGNSMLYDAVSASSVFDPKKVYFHCYDLDVQRGFVNETDRFTATYYSTDDSESNSGKNFGFFNFNNWPIARGESIKHKQNPMVAVKINVNPKYHNSLVNVACQAYAANLGPNEKINEAFAVMPVTVMATGESSINQINSDYRNDHKDDGKKLEMGKEYTL